MMNKTLEAGQKLDALIAEKVMGYKYHKEAYSNEPGTGWVTTTPAGIELFCDNKSAPKYSTDIAAAWKVVEKIIEMDGTMTIVHQPHAGPEWTVHFAAARGLPGECKIGATGLIGASTAPHAISLAALETLKIGRPNRSTEELKGKK